MARGFHIIHSKTKGGPIASPISMNGSVKAAAGIR